MEIEQLSKEIEELTKSCNSKYISISKINKKELNDLNKTFFNLRMKYYCIYIDNLIKTYLNNFYQKNGISLDLCKQFNKK